MPPAVGLCRPSRTHTRPNPAASRNMKPMTEPRIRPHLAAALVALVALLLYARTVGYEYIWDDLSYVASFGHYQWFDGIVRAVTEQVFTSRAYYRPLAILSFAADGDASVQHGINVVLHAVNTVLVLYVTRAFMPKDVAESKVGLWAAALGALLFAVHPVAVESTVWVSGRFDTLMCTFVLGTCVAALGGELTLRRQALVFVLFACAMGSKESAIGLPVALPLLLLFKWRLEGKEVAQIKAQMGVLVRELTALALAVALYIAVRLAVVHTLFADKVTFAGGSVLDKLNVASLAVTAFVKLMVAPISHSAPLHLFSYEAGSGVLTNTLVVVAGILALLAALFLKKPKFNFPLALLAALAMSWPALHLIGIPNWENIISDRYALAPLALLLAGLAAAAGAWVARRVPEFGASGQRIPMYVVVVCLLWAGALAAYTSATIPLWRNESVFWDWVYKQAPEFVYAHKNYIRKLMRELRWEEADTELGRFWSAHPKMQQNMGIQDMSELMLIRAHVGDYEGALRVSRAVESSGEDALKTLPPRDLGMFYGMRGLIEMNMGHWLLAVDYLEKSVRTFGEDIRMAFLYAQALHMAGQRRRSDEVFRQALLKVGGTLAAEETRKREIWMQQAPALNSQTALEQESHD